MNGSWSVVSGYAHAILVRAPLLGKPAVAPERVTTDN